MIAIDTNVVVRFLTRDDEAQWARADALIADHEVFVSTTVLLEAAWVLRSVHGLGRVEIVQALEKFAGLPGVRLDEPERVMRASAMSRQGLDFADALHLAAASGCEAFATFDRRLCGAAPADAAPVREP